jgi:hypothetical protein
MRNMKIKKRWLLGIGVILLWITATTPVARGQAQHFRWDIISANFSTGTLSAGGIASARANDCSKITLTGSGTFVAPAGGGGTSSAVTGGGTWETFSGSSPCPCNSTATGTTTGSGTYEVTGLVRWDLAPGTPPLPNDNIGNPADNRAGLAVFRILYNDGSRGILVVSCHLVNTPDSVFEGITASKGFVDYWNRQAPPAPPGNENRTTFHVQ